MRFLFILLFLGASFSLFAQPPFTTDARHDSIAISHTSLYLDLSNTSLAYLRAQAEIKIVPKVNGVNSLILDLKSLNVDSVLHGGTLQSFYQQSDSLIISLPAYVLGDSLTFLVYYQGLPYTDQTFGGLFFQQGYAYNMGVSLNEYPHSFGRSWYPCFDNFQTRTMYRISLETAANHRGIASGELISDSLLLSGNKLWTYALNQPIPSYLLSIAVGPYVVSELNLLHLDGSPIKARLAAAAGDTANFKASAIHLQDALHIYEAAYGPYPWDLIGYVLIPGTTGAMEHAANIAYPRLLANGTLAYEDIFVHELSHNWWGNLVTCQTSEDMWLNEGFAVYSEYLFNEKKYSPQVAMGKYRASHRTNILRAHIIDNGYWPLSGIPNQHTYSRHSYEKGAGAVHTLRHYLKDSLFFSGLSQSLSQYAFSNWNSLTFKQVLESNTGKDLSPFFDTWIFEGGWPFVRLDSHEVVLQTGNQIQLKMYLNQKRVARSNFAQQMPVTVRYYKSDRTFVEERVLVSGAQTEHTSPLLSFSPVAITCNEDEGLSIAQTSETRVIRQPGTYSYAQANMNVSLISTSDSVWLRVEQHYVAADPDIHGRTVSPQRWWTVNSIGPEPLTGWRATASIAYNGRTVGSNSHLDHLLITHSEDSLLLLWRPNASTPWVEYPYYQVNTGVNTTDLLGSYQLSELIPGDYTFAKGTAITGIEEVEETSYLVYPNPVKGGSLIRLRGVAAHIKPGSLQLYDLNGRLLQTPELVNDSGPKDSAQLFIPKQPNGWYILRWKALHNDGSERIHQARLIIWED